MTEVTSGISLEIDSSEVVEATQDLERFAAVGTKTESSTKRLDAALQALVGSTAEIARSFSAMSSSQAVMAKAFQDTAAAAQSANALATAAAKMAQETRPAAAGADGLASAGERLVSTLREQVALFGKSSEEVLRYKAAQAGVGEAAAPLILQLQNQRAAQQAAAEAALKEAAAQREAAQVKQQAERSQAGFLEALKFQSATLGKSQADILEYKAALLGVSNEAAPYITRIKEAANATQKLGVGQKLTAQQAQQMSFQLNDLFVQIASGGSPLTALIQQGSQLSGTFGGLGNTFTALRTLITPARVALGGIGAAVATLTLAYAQGAKEQDAFARGLILTGNASGQTVGGLNAMAKAISGIAGTQGKAAEALTLLVNSGGVVGGALEKAAAAAIKLERVGGPAVAETVKQFSELGKNPLQAAVKLNEQINFLTESVYRQIKSLTDQGRVAEAARVAQLAYAEALEGRTGQLEARLGTFERAWRSLGDVAKGAWDKMLNIGRAETVEGEIAKAEAALTAAQTRLEGRGRRGGTTAELRGGGSSQEVQDARDLLDTKREGAKLDRQIAEAQAGRAARTQALHETEKLVEASLSSQAKLAKDLESARTRMELAGRDPKEIEGALSAITQSSAAFQQSMEVRLALLRNATSEMVRAAQATGAAIESQFRRGLLSEVEFIEQSRDAALKAGAVQIEATAKEIELAKQKRENTAAVISLQGRLNELLDQQVQIAIAADNKIAENRARLKRSADQFFAGEVEQGNQETTAFIVAETAKRDALTKAIADQARELREANQIMSAEAGLLGKSSAARNVAIQQLRIRIALERQLDQIRNAGFDTDERDDRISRATANANKAIQNIATQDNINYIADLLDPTRAETFGDALTKAFNGAGNALVKLVNTLEDYGSKRIAIEERLASIKKDPGLDEETRQKGIAALIEQQTKAQVSAYATMAGAAKGFFQENSKGYKTLEAIETGFRIAQIAGAVQATAAKLFGLQEVTAVTIAEETKRQAVQEAFRASELAADAAHAQASIAQSQAVGQASAAPAIAKEGSISGLYGAIAMAALMAALGYASAGGFDKRSGNNASASQRQGGAATGTLVTANQRSAGTVFGNDAAKSESIANSIDLLEKTARIELSYSRGQLSALEDIRDSMAGLGNLIVRSVGGGLTTGKNLGIKTGTLSVNQGDPILNALGKNEIFGLDFSKELNIFGNIGFVKSLQALWGKVKQEVVDSGLSILGNVGDVIVQQYADVATTKSSFFGLVKKTTESTVFGEVEQQVADQFSRIFTSIGDTMILAADALGKDGSALKDAIAAFPVEIERLSLKDLKGEDLEAAISAAIGAFSDGLAKSVLPGLDDFQQVGEGYFETLIRVSSGIEQASYQLELLGVSAINFTDIARKQGDVGAEIVRQSIAAAETAGGALSSVGRIVQTLSGSAEDLAETYTQLVDVRGALIKVGESGESLSVAMIRGAGGLDNLQSGLDTFFSEFFTEGEQLRANTDALVAEFARLGRTVPQSREEFKALAAALNDGTEAGDKMFAKLIGLSGAFDEVADKFEEIANARTSLDIELLRALGKESEAVAKERELELEALRKLDPALAQVKQAIYAATDAAAEMARIEDLLSGVDSVIADFLSGDALTQFRAERIKQILADGGIEASTAGIIGATRDQIVELWNAVGVDGKEAILDAYGAWVQLQDALAQSQIKELLNGIASSADELKEVVDPSGDTLVQSYQKNIDEIERLQEGLDKILGRTVKTFQEQLQDLLATQKSIADFRSGSLAGSIEDAFLRTLNPQDRIARLKATEQRLFGQLQTADDPVAVAQELQGVILDRIRLEASLQDELHAKQKEALEDQLSGLKGIKDLAKDIAQFTGSLKFSDLSPKGFGAQLADARSLFETTLSQAKAGDTFAQGNLTSNARAYLDEARAYFASSSAYATIFDTVMAGLDSIGATNVDPQIALLEAQLAALEKQTDTSVQEFNALTQIDAGLAQRDQSLQGLIDQLIQKSESQIQAIREEAMKQMEQLAAIYAEVKPILDRIKQGITAVADEAERAVNGR
jgi:phage-related minor tail protein